MKKKRLVCFALALLLLLPLGLSAYAAEGDGEPVRVGFFAFSGYHEMDEAGRRSGYGYEFLQKLAAFTDWRYEYLGYDLSYFDTLELLSEGEVDVVTSVSRTPAREEEFLFSDLPIGTNATIFTVKAGNTAVTAGDYDSYDGLRIGMLDGNSKNDVFRAFSEEKGFRYEPVYFEMEEELAAALQAGTVDGAVSGSLRKVQNEWVIESLSPSDFYIVTRKDRPDLMEEINAAIGELNLQDPSWQTELQQKYYSTDGDSQVLLTGEERACLEQLRSSGEPLRVLFNPDRSPYSYFNEQGEAAGVFPAVFALVAQRLGLKYQVVPCQSREEYYRLRAEGADIVLDFTDDYYLAEKEGYKLTEPYIDVNFARLTRSGFKGSVQKVAVLTSSDGLKSYVERNIGEREIVPCGSIQDCVYAVVSGAADSTVLYAYTAEQVILHDVRNLMSFTLLGDASCPYSMAVRADRGYLLLSVLNKALGSLSGAEMGDIILQETEQSTQDVDIDLVSFIYANPIYGLLGVFFLCLFVFVLIILALRIRNQKNLKAKIEEVSEQYEAQKKALSDALAMADQANRSKTTFLNNMSHDIRTPMNAIIGYTALASTHLDNKEQTQDYLSKIAQSSNHLLSLINDVLDMSRIESGHVHVECRPENLADILHGLRNIVHADIHAKSLEFYIDTLDVVNEEIACDKLRLNQILLNLLSNAIKFTPPGGTVSLCVAQKPSGHEDRGIYEFRVKDTGIGMSPEFARHIFEPFTRERTSTVSGIQGTGLGMAITKNIVNMMNGDIQVHSQQNVGTEFVVTLEFAFCGEKAKPAPLVELQGLRALVADDDLLCCQSVSKMLREIGMRSEWTRYGKEAVIRAGEAHEMRDPFAVYVIDWAMPDQNGVETVRCIRQAVGDEAPIILLSAYDWSDIEQEAREAGVTDFVSKPLFFSELYRTLERSLGRGKQSEDTEVLLPEEDFSGKRILLVEDNELNREIATELLSEAGFHVDCAENGRIAVEKLAASRTGDYDLILMDVQMPVMNGYEATKAIRQLENPVLANLPVIAMTANAFEEDKQQAAAAGMDGYLAKPIDIQKMFAVLRETLDRLHSGNVDSL